MMEMVMAMLLELQRGREESKGPKLREKKAEGTRSLAKERRLKPLVGFALTLTLWADSSRHAPTYCRST